MTDSRAGDRIPKNLEEFFEEASPHFSETVLMGSLGETGCDTP